MTTLAWSALDAAARNAGLGLLGALNLDGARDGVAWAGPDEALSDDAALALLGYDGPSLWAAFSAAPEASDGAPNPLDRWTRRVGDALAIDLGARAIYPFDQPHPPFLAWARRIEAVWPSPLGMLVSADRGLWSSWRMALALPSELDDAPAPTAVARPCESCADKPCLTACPVDAFSSDGYDVAKCGAHISSPEGADCMALGCRARRACPVGATLAHGPDQAAFHMRAFRRNVAGG